MNKNVRHLCNSCVLAASVLLLPQTALAAVFISEVAWMGTSESANHEWIELTNDGPPLNVEGWILSDLQNLQIELAGTIPANSSVVLERSSEASAPGTAFLIYTGALVNTGTDLSLHNTAGQLVERVAGGENWQSIGGDNVTKETAQYSSQGWYTAKATPGQYTNAYEAPIESEEEPTTPEKKSPASTKKDSDRVQTVPLTLPGITLQLVINAQKIGYVNQRIAFSAQASGIGKHLENSLVYQWNFGDGFTAVGEKPEHIFAYAGTYVVTVKGEYQRQVQITRHEITILPVKMSLTQNKQGDVQVHNNTQYELDISGYKVAGTKEFTFPAYSVVLPNQTVTIPRKYLKSNFNPLVALYDTESEFLASTFPPAQLATVDTRSAQVVTAQAVTRPPVRPASIRTISSAKSPVAVSTSEPEPEPVRLIDTNTETKAAHNLMTSQSNVASVATPQVPRNERLVYVGLCILILLGIFGIYLSPRRNQLD